MIIVSDQFALSSKKRNQMIDITSQIENALSKTGIENGDLIVFCPHTTAAITINENADPDVPHDILLTLSDLFPQQRPGYRHNEGNSDAHCKSSLFGPSQQIIISGGQLVLGTWQGVFFCEFDGPRNRNVKLQFRGN